MGQLLNDRMAKTFLIFIFQFFYCMNKLDFHGISEICLVVLITFLLV